MQDTGHEQTRHIIPGHLAPLQQLQETNSVRCRLLGLQRLHLQPQAHWLLLLFSNVLGRTRAPDEPPGFLGRRAPSTVQRRVTAPFRHPELRESRDLRFLSRVQRQATRSAPLDPTHLVVPVSELDFQARLSGEDSRLPIRRSRCWVRCGRIFGIKSCARHCIPLPPLGEVPRKGDGGVCTSNQ